MSRPPTPDTERPTEEVLDSASAQLSITDLGDSEHFQLLVRAINRTLSTEVAEITYAQIIDGLPIADVAWDSRSQPHNGHPILDNTHEELCPGMLDKARGFRREFRPEILSFDAQLLHGYRACAPGSRGFKTRLVEMVAVAVHQIAAILFELDTSVHKNDGITEWAPPKSDDRYWKWHPDGPLPTLFSHTWYVEHGQYPRQVADMVGYWAEARILGGVVLFDRRQPDAEPRADRDAIYFHSDRQDVTYRIYQLLPEQRNALLDFLLADELPSTCPLPILGDRNNRIRVDPEEPIRTTGIYRDLWERNGIPPGVGDVRLRDVWDKTEFPTLDDYSASRHRALDRKERIELEKAWASDAE
ncbi:hypothetical protein NEMBOFW57_000257 [Staphylotrichum longicolle]|uniref:Uncharacterized protein n=1 Tax=Staphylotrichum longicolle TaxID=669026 RepID=A0AAD4F3R7_9PEZI|nr:hypothetical protein NEMBOFW57_000257 [Staphylotrichum longicolle]